MRISKCVFWVSTLCFLSLFAVCRKEIGLSPVEQVGKMIFFDSNLSDPPGQSCSACHHPYAGWTGPDSTINEGGSVYPGASPGRFGNRKPPSVSYTGGSPVLFRSEEGIFIGGSFWDGRASGLVLGDPVVEQAQAPFLNPLEHNNPSQQAVVQKVAQSSYAGLFIKVWGTDSLDWKNDAEGSFKRIARSIAAYERSAEVSPFNSRFDDFWKRAGSVEMDVEAIDESNWKSYRGLGLSDEELEGVMLFHTKGKCSNCHLLSSVNGKPPLFTDFTYDNIGLPKNPANPFYSIAEEWNPEGTGWIDGGLGVFLKDSKEFASYAAENYGKQKVPTLRNVDLRPEPDFVKAYMHNGFFKTLEDIVHFYNTRDIQAENWPQPEVSANVNTEEMGDLGLDERQEKLIVLFLKTLTDRTVAQPPLK